MRMIFTQAVIQQWRCDTQNTHNTQNSMGGGSSANSAYCAQFAQDITAKDPGGSSKDEQEQVGPRDDNEWEEV